MLTPNLNPSRSSRILPRNWFARPSPVVAPDLLGKVFVRQMSNGDRLRGLIVETEAYAPGDPACHAYKRRTNRNRAMFGPAGHLYIYLIYGIYHCLNIVTDAEGVGSAVLIRALELEHLPAWISPKKRKQPQQAAAGPGLLCLALDLNRQQDGWPLLDIPGTGCWVEEGQSLSPAQVTQTTRIGLTQGIETPWRWYVDSSLAISKR